MKNQRVFKRFFAPTVLGLGMAVVPPLGLAALTIEFEEAELFAELNDTDGDLGIHSSIDGEAWERLSIIDTKKRKVLDIFAFGRFRKQGLTQLFFESAEPDFGELSPEEFFARMPEGEYTITGTTLDGQKMKSTAEFTHVMPAPADNVKVNGVDVPENCDVMPLPAVSPPVTVTWDEVTTSHPTIGEFDPGIVIVNQQIVVERAEPEELVLSVDLPPGVTSLDIPQDFTNQDSGDGFKLEILIREEGGNQTAIETCFALL